MRFPDWIAPVGKWYQAQDGLWYQDYRIRLWHPGLWMAVVKSLLRGE